MAWEWRYRDTIYDSIKGAERIERGRNTMSKSLFDKIIDFMGELFAPSYYDKYAQFAKKKTTKSAPKKKKVTAKRKSSPKKKKSTGS